MSMMWTVSLIICALSFGGILECTGMMSVIANKLLEFAKSTGSLVLVTIISALFCNVLLGDHCIAIAIPEGLVGLVYARSGMACKKGIAPANKVGVIDADYRGEIMVALYNHGNEAVTVEPGDRIAQLVLTPFITAAFDEADSLDETDRGNGGFGSTGTK